MEGFVLAGLIGYICVEAIVYLVSPLPELQRRKAVADAQEALIDAWTTYRLRLPPRVSIEWFEVEADLSVTVHLAPGTISGFDEAERGGLRKLAAKICNTISRHVTVTFVHGNEALSIRPSFVGLLSAIAACFPSLRRRLSPDQARQALDGALATKQLQVEPLAVVRFEVADDLRVSAHLAPEARGDAGRGDKERLEKIASDVCRTIGRRVPVTFVCGEEALTLPPR